MYARPARLSALWPLVLLLGGCEAGVNADISIPAGAESGGAAVINGRIVVGGGARVDGELSTVNGPVEIGPDATVEDVNTVNGVVTLGSGARADSVQAVNGGVTLEEGARATGSLEIVQGDVRLAPGAEVAGDVGAVAGTIRLRDARIGGRVTTVTADVTLTGESVIGQGIRVESRTGSGGGRPRIVVGPGSRVDGVLDFDGPADVYVSEAAEIGDVRGVVAAGDVVRFRGSEPDLR